MSSARELYEVYQKTMEAQGTGVDNYDDLPNEDHVAWEAVADYVSD